MGCKDRFSDGKSSEGRIVLREKELKDKYDHENCSNSGSVGSSYTDSGESGNYFEFLNKEEFEDDKFFGSDFTEDDELSSDNNTLNIEEINEVKYIEILLDNKLDVLNERSKIYNTKKEQNEFQERFKKRVSHCVFQGTEIK